MMITPLPPEPPRFMFNSEKEYFNARNTWLRNKAEREEALNTNIAVMIVSAGVLVAFTIFAITSLMYMTFGIKGVVGLFLACGLFWAAVSRVKMMIGGDAE